jgi:cytochrome c553
VELALYSERLSMRIIPIVLLFSTLGAAGKLSFNRDIRPILSNKCFACHGPDSKTREAKLRLDQRESALKVIEPGAPDKSELIARIAHLDAEEIMPPPETNKSLSPKEIRSLRKWIEEGAQFEPHWAFVPATRKNEPRNIDYFIIRRLQDSNLKLSSPASKETLIRRVSLDLTGIPASLEEVSAFVDDSSPDAYEKLIDRLLTSPRYGEHMAAFWMEAFALRGYRWLSKRPLPLPMGLARLAHSRPESKSSLRQIHYSPTGGRHASRHHPASTNRNRAFAATIASIPKPGRFPKNGRLNTSPTGSIPLARSSWDSPVSCARCHDHKFDPISQKEYYQLFAYFNNVPEFGTGPNNGNSPPYIPVPKDYPNIDEATNKARTPEPITWQKKGQYSGGRQTSGSRQGEYRHGHARAEVQLAKPIS